MKKNGLFVALVFIGVIAIAACKQFETAAPSGSTQPQSSQPAVASGSQETKEGEATAQSNPSDTAPKGTESEKRSSAETSQASDPSVRRAPLLFSSSLVGSRVKDSKGNDVGKIKDLLFDPENRRVVYVILSVSNRDIAVPLSAVKMDPQTQNYTLEMTGESLAEAPKIGADKKVPSELGESPLASSTGKQPAKATP